VEASAPGDSPSTSALSMHPACEGWPKEDVYDFHPNHNGPWQQLVISQSYGSKAINIMALVEESWAWQFEREIWTPNALIAKHELWGWMAVVMVMRTPCSPGG